MNETTYPQIIHLFLLNWGGFIGGLALLYSSQFHSASRRVTYQILGAIGLLIAYRNHLDATLGQKEAASHVLLISGAINALLFEIFVLQALTIYQIPMSNLTGRSIGYLLKSGGISVMAFSGYVAYAQAADEAISLVATALGSGAIIQSLGTKKNTVLLVPLIICLGTWSILQRTFWHDSGLPVDLLRLGFFGAAMLLTFWPPDEGQK